MKKINFLIISLILIAKISSAQNLVLNGSFEECKNSNDSFLKKKFQLKKQVKILRGRPFYFHETSKDLGVPINVFGKQLASDGKAYIGLSVTTDQKGECDHREFVQLKLKKKLKQGFKYTVSFQISLAENSGYYTDQIGVSFSSVDLEKHKTLNQFIGNPSVTNPYTNYLNDTVGWSLLSFNYNAKGGEEYLIIGNFQECNRTTRKTLSPNTPDLVEKNLKKHYLSKISNTMDDYAAIKKKQHEAYYFIDDVQVIETAENSKITYLTAKEACECKTPTSVSNLINDGEFNLNTDSLTRVWKTASTGTPDFFKGNVGLYLYSAMGKNNREYIYAPLKQKLNPCKKYCFSFKIKNNLAYKYIVDQIGAVFIDSVHAKNDRMRYDLIPDFQSPKLHLIANSNQWLTLCSEFTPHSCANYVIIGNFADDDHTFILSPNELSIGGPFSYYFIDDIKLYQIDTIAGCQYLCEPLSEEKQDKLIIDKTQRTEKLLLDTIRLNFDLSSTTLNLKIDSLVDPLKMVLANDSSATIVVSGHTDAAGLADYNYKLSEQRAKNVYEILISRGIPKTKITYNYFGSDQPYIINKDIPEQKLNRRVEIKVVKKQ